MMQNHPWKIKMCSRYKVPNKKIAKGPWAKSGLYMCCTYKERLIRKMTTSICTQRGDNHNTCVCVASYSVLLFEKKLRTSGNL